MLDDLQVTEATEVTPRKMERKKEELPAAIKAAYDATEMGKAREITIQAPAGWEGNLGKLAVRLLGLLKRYAASVKTVAFKASAHGDIGSGKITLYWQKKPLRLKKSPPVEYDPPSVPPDSEGGAPIHEEKKRKKT